MLIVQKRIEPGILSHVSDIRMAKNGRKVLLWRSALGLRTGRRAKIPGNSAHVSSKKEVTVMYTKC